MKKLALCLLFLTATCMAVGQRTKTICLSYKSTDFTFTEQGDGTLSIESYKYRLTIGNILTTYGMPYIDISVLIGPHEECVGFAYTPHYTLIRENVKLSMPIIAPTESQGATSDAADNGSTEAWRPTETIMAPSVYNSGKYRIMGFFVCPFRYDTVNRDLYLVDSVQVDMTLQQNDNDSKMVSPLDMTDIVRDMVINKDEMDSLYSMKYTEEEGAWEINVKKFFYCQMYCEKTDGTVGVIGVAKQKKGKEIDGREYVALNIGPVVTDGDFHRRSGEELESEGTTRYFRQDGKKVYVYSDEIQADELVLDFGLKEGDRFVRANGEAMVVQEVKDTVIFCGADVPVSMLVLEKEDDPGVMDTWIEGVGSVSTGFLPCDATTDIRNMKVVECSIDGVYALFAPLVEKGYEVQSMRLREVDECTDGAFYYEFVGDKLHVYGNVETGAADGVILQCFTHGDTVDISEVEIPYMLVTRHSFYKADVWFSVAKEDVNVVKYKGRKIEERAYVDVEPDYIATPRTIDEQKPTVPVLHDLTGRSLTTPPAKGMWIENGVKRVR